MSRDWRHESCDGTPEDSVTQLAPDEEDSKLVLVPAPGLDGAVCVMIPRPWHSEWQVQVVTFCIHCQNRSTGPEGGIKKGVHRAVRPTWLSPTGPSPPGRRTRPGPLVQWAKHAMAGTPARAVTA
jgi:hypothetical protein